MSGTSGSSQQADGSRPSDGPPTADGLADALREFAARPARHLVALDFDGTLAPLVDDPTASELLPTAREAVERLAALPDDARTVLALVSGRNLADLAERARPPVGTHLVGSHGAEHGVMTATGVKADPLTLTTEQEEALAALAAALAGLADALDGVWVQTKPSAVVVHTRLAASAATDKAVAAADAAAARLGLHAMHGKDVVEIAVVETSKGEAIAHLRDHLARDGAAGDDAPDVRVLYAGDDTTDERALAVLGAGDVGIKVGPGPTVAGFRVADPAALAEALGDLARGLAPDVM